MVEMKFLKYHGVLTFDSKNLFDEKKGLNSLGEKHFVKIGSDTICLSGFYSIGNTIFKEPIFISFVFGEKNILYIYFSDEDMLKKAFLDNFLDCLSYYDYKIIYIKNEIINRL